MDDHYKTGKIECIDYMREVLTPEEFRGYLRGCVIKYMHRLLLKNDPRDNCRKALVYLNWLADEFDDTAMQSSSDSHYPPKAEDVWGGQIRGGTVGRLYSPGSGHDPHDALVTECCGRTSWARVRVEHSGFTRFRCATCIHPDTLEYTGDTSILPEEHFHPYA